MAASRALPLCIALLFRVVRMREELTVINAQLQIWLTWNFVVMEAYKSVVSK